MRVLVTAGAAGIGQRGDGQAGELLRGERIEIEVDLGAGSAVHTVWTCDLSAEYVRINGEYRT